MCSKQIRNQLLGMSCRIRRKTQLNSAEAAAAAARADALARSSKLKVTSSRSREAARLAAENKALLEVLTTVADGNPSIQAKLQAIRQQYPVGTKVCFQLLASVPVLLPASSTNPISSMFGREPNYTVHGPTTESVQVCGKGCEHTQLCTADVRHDSITRCKHRHR